MEGKKFFTKWASKKQENDQQPDHPVECKNCGTTFTGNFCPNCGQSVKEYNRPFRILIYDFMGTIFAFDTRFFKTLKTLLFSPGKFSSDFLDGRRAQYMQPFQFYVFVSFIFFLLLNIKTNQIISDTTLKLGNNKNISAVLDSTQKALGADTAYVNLRPIASDTTLLKHLSKTQRDEQAVSSSVKKLQQMLQKKYDKPGNSNIEKRLLHNTIRLMNYPEMFASKALRYFSWSLFFLMPIFAFWLWAFFHKTRRYYSGHLIYSLASLSTAFLFLIVMVAVKLIFPGKQSAPENYLFLVIPVYLWIGLKKFYHRSVLNTTVKFFLLSFIYFVTSMVAMLIVFVLSIYF